MTTSPEVYESPWSPERIYDGQFAAGQLRKDKEDPYRAGLYSAIKADHPENDLTGKPCDCQTGGRQWEDFAMHARFPGRRAERNPDLELEAG